MCEKRIGVTQVKNKMIHFASNRQLQDCFPVAACNPIPKHLTTTHDRDKVICKLCLHSREFYPRTCNYPDCDSLHAGKGWCHKHYHWKVRRSIFATPINHAIVRRYSRNNEIAYSPTT